MTPELIHQLVVTVIVGGAIYGGIRADLKWLRASVERAHQRIDDHIQHCPKS